MKQKSCRTATSYSLNYGSVNHLPPRVPEEEKEKEKEKDDVKCIEMF